MNKWKISFELVEFYDPTATAIDWKKFYEISESEFDQCSFIDYHSQLVAKATEKTAVHQLVISNVGLKWSSRFKAWLDSILVTLIRIRFNWCIFLFNTRIHIHLHAYPVFYVILFSKNGIYSMNVLQRTNCVQLFSSQYLDLTQWSIYIDFYLIIWVMENICSHHQSPMKVFKKMIEEKC